MDEQEHDTHQSGQLVPTTGGREISVQGADASSQLASFFGAAVSEAVHNFKGDDKALWKFASQATSPGALTADDFPNDGIDVEYVYCHKVPIQGPTEGEIEDAIRTVLFTPDGKRYAFVSNGIASDAARMFMAFGFQKFAPPIKLQLVRFKTNKNRTMFTLVPV